jgi:polyketide synthase PksM
MEPDILSFKNKAQAVLPVAEIYKKYDIRGLQHKGIMKAEGNIYRSDDALLFEASIGPEGRSSAGHFMFHPALMDGCAIATLPLFDAMGNEQENLFLPLYYERFRAAACINERCYSYVPVSSIKRINELISYSVYFFNDAGNRIGELTGLTSKMVRDGTVESRVQGKAPLKAMVHLPVYGGEPLAFLKGLIVTYFDVDPGVIGNEMGYYNMGFDSVSLVRLAGIIGDNIGADLPPTLLFEYPTLSLLADHLSKAYAKKFDALKVAEND